jgi:hypothetical protein
MFHLEYAADAQLLKLQRLQNKVLRATESLDRRTLVRDMRVLRFRFSRYSLCTDPTENTASHNSSIVP